MIHGESYILVVYTLDGSFVGSAVPNHQNDQLGNETRDPMQSEQMNESIDQSTPFIHRGSVSHKPWICQGPTSLQTVSFVNRMDPVPYHGQCCTVQCHQECGFGNACFYGTR